MFDLLMILLIFLIPFLLSKYMRKKRVSKMTRSGNALLVSISSQQKDDPFLSVVFNTKVTLDDNSEVISHKMRLNISNEVDPHTLLGSKIPVMYDANNNNILPLDEWKKILEK